MRHQGRRRLAGRSGPKGAGDEPRRSGPDGGVASLLAAWYHMKM